MTVRLPTAQSAPAVRQSWRYYCSVITVLVRISVSGLVGGTAPSQAVTGHKYADRARFCSSIFHLFSIFFFRVSFPTLLFLPYALYSIYIVFFATTDRTAKSVDTKTPGISTFTGLKHEDFASFQCDTQNNSTKTMGRTVDQEVHAAFVEFRAKEDDKARDPVSW